MPTAALKAPPCSDLREEPSTLAASFMVPTLFMLDFVAALLLHAQGESSALSAALHRGACEIFRSLAALSRNFSCLS